MGSVLGLWRKGAGRGRALESQNAPAGPLVESGEDGRVSNGIFRIRASGNRAHTPRWVAVLFLSCLLFFFGLSPAWAAKPVAPKAPPRAVPGLRAPGGWVHGRWKRGWHGGRYGWWWRTQHRWYFYLTPVSPYPPYYGSGPMPIGALPPGGLVPVPPPVPQPPSLSSWYCVSPPGFYPFVTSCSGGWLETGVPAYVPPVPVVVVPQPGPP